MGVRDVSEQFSGFRTIPTHKTRFVTLPQIFDLLVDDRTPQAARIIISFRWCLVRTQGVTLERNPKKVLPETLTMTEMR